MNNPLATISNKITGNNQGISGKIAPANGSKGMREVGKSAMSERNFNLILKMVFITFIIVMCSLYLPRFVSAGEVKLAAFLDGLRFNMGWLGSFIIWFVSNVGRLGIWLGFGYLVYFVTKTMYNNPTQANNYIVITLIALLIFLLTIKYAQTNIIPALSTSPTVTAKFTY